MAGTRPTAHPTTPPTYAYADRRAARMRKNKRSNAPRVASGRGGRGATATASSLPLRRPDAVQTSTLIADVLESMNRQALEHLPGAIWRAHARRRPWGG